MCVCVYVFVCGPMLRGVFRCAAAQSRFVCVVDFCAAAQFRKLLAAEFASRNCAYTAAVPATVCVCVCVCVCMCMYMWSCVACCVPMRCRPRFVCVVDFCAAAQ